MFTKLIMEDFHSSKSFSDLLIRKHGEIVVQIVLIILNILSIQVDSIYVSYHTGFDFFFF